MTPSGIELATFRLVAQRRNQLLHQQRAPVSFVVLLRFVDRASWYNLVNKANSVHNLFLVYLSISTSFGRLCANHQEKQLSLCDTWYLLFCVDDCMVRGVE